MFVFSSKIMVISESPLTMRGSPTELPIM